MEKYSQNLPRSEVSVSNIFYWLMINKTASSQQISDQMSQIGLINSQAKKEGEKRPPQLSVSKIFSNNHKWRECKVTGKNISIRSYSATCNFQNKMYLYGGYQMLHGPLSDFYEINLDESQSTFHWKEVPVKGGCNPGKRSKHGLLGGKSGIYLVGGLKANDQASNQLYFFNPHSSEWSLLKPQGESMPGIESFASVLIQKGDQEKIIIGFGFNEAEGQPSNRIYEYDITKNKLAILFQGSKTISKNSPCPRVGAAMSSDNSNIFIFGGKGDGGRLNDLWSFSLSDYKFTRLKQQGEIPSIRNGHTINYNEGQLYVFGGIHDVTWELDDLHIYNLKNGKWVTLEQDSPRKIDKRSNHSDLEDKNFDQKSIKKKNWYEAHGHQTGKQNSLASPGKNNHSTTVYYEQGVANRSDSPGKMLQQQRKKVFYQKKAEMLSNFQVTKQQKERLISLQTTSQTMKISLDVIGTPDPKTKSQQDKLTQFGKETTSKFLEPLQNNSNIVIGKKPCARDGHCSTIIGGDLIIFGGDRHQMSFNDIYKLNLSLAMKELPS